jgi:hypothetical protein
MIRWSRAILFVGGFLSLGCHELTGNGEAYSLTDSWDWTSGLDWFSYFNLRQNGAQVAGEIVYMIPGTGPIDTAAVTGRVDGRRVTLQWDSQFGVQLEHRTLNGVISVDARTITVTESLNGGPWTSAGTLRRSP